MNTFDTEKFINYVEKKQESTPAASPIVTDGPSYRIAAALERIAAALEEMRGK
jgi:hypothetical protein